MNIKAWIAASRLPAQIFMFPAVLFGQALHYMLTGEFSFNTFTWLVVYGIAMHFFIVYINDVADLETDQKNTTFTPFSGGSRVLVDGKLSKQALLIAGLVMAGLVLFVGNVLAIDSGQWTIVLWVVVGLFLMHAYSFPPIKLSYRGYGEVLQMLGVGVVLPVVGYLAQGGSYDVLPWFWIAALLPAQYSMAISTSLPDEPSDKESKKNTTVVALGVKKAERVMLMLFAIAIAGVTLISTTESAFIFLILGLLILFVQIYIFYKKKPKPGDFSMFIFVSLAILLNTVLVLGWSLTLLL